MEQEIASYLFRNKSCILPGIGELKITRKPADTDYVNAQIKAPVESIDFLSGNDNSPVFNELSAVSEHLKMLLDTNRTVALTGIGVFTKDNLGRISFTEEEINPVLTYPVHIERVIRYETKTDLIIPAVHSINIQEELIQDIKEPLPGKDKWRLVAVIIGIICLTVLLINIFQNGASSGNVINIKALDAGATYRTK